jgi:hypothetical protein
MNPLTRFFHELFNPHCEQCAVDREVKEINPVVENLKAELARLYKQLENLQDSNPIVEVLRIELERAYRNNDKLLEQLFDKIKYERELLEQTQISPPKPNFQNVPMIAGAKNWAIRRRELEQQKRLEAQENQRLKAEGITPVTEESLDKELEEVRENA